MPYTINDILKELKKRGVKKPNRQRIHQLIKGFTQVRRYESKKYGLREYAYEVEGILKPSQFKMVKHELQVNKVGFDKIMKHFNKGGEA